MTLKAAIFIYIRAHAFEERAGNNNEVTIVNNERVGSSDYLIVRSERKRHFHIWHKHVPNFHIWHKRVPRICYLLHKILAGYLNFQRAMWFDVWEREL